MFLNDVAICLLTLFKTLLALMSDAVAHTLDGCEVQPLGEELNPDREELLVDMDVVRERGLEIINTTAYIAITGTTGEIVHVLKVSQKVTDYYYFPLISVFNKAPLI